MHAFDADSPRVLTVLVYVVHTAHDISPQPKSSENVMASEPEKVAGFGLHINRPYFVK